MKAFADLQVTKPVCSIFNIDVCSDEDKAEIAAIDAKTDEELIATAENIAVLAQEADKEFEAFLERLNKEYEEEERKHNEALAAIKEDNKFKYVQQIFAKRGLENPLHENVDDDDDMMGGEL